MTILDTIRQTIKNHIRDEKAVFVFSTDIACSTWAEWAVKNTGVRAVPKNRFVAWDKFKAESAAEKSEGHPVPSLLRKIFIENLMSENKTKKYFSKIIAPEFAENSESFTDWICSVLPSLKAWNERYEEINGKKVLDEEDADYKFLYEKYSDFLLKNPHTEKEWSEKLYEPAWESKKLIAKEKEYYVFYPEILDDYCDYKDFFEGNDIPALHVFFAKDSDDTSKNIKAEHYSNTRTEFRSLCLYLRYLHENEKISWRDMAVSVPDIDTYLPYLERDFCLYCIPHIVRSGRKVTGINAGSIFTCIKKVAEEDFSYDSMRALLTNSFVPWLKPELNEELVREGTNHKCIINFYKDGKKIDVWKEGLSNTKNALVPVYYNTIKKWVSEISEAETFSEVRRVWFSYRDKLFDFDSLLEDDERNLVLGHCLDKLDELIKIEEKYGMSVSNPFDFFVNELDNAVYQPQSKHTGVSIFKYKVSATAAFPYQFVVDANQTNLSVMNSTMKFLNNEKRAALKIQDEDTATESFILLYSKDKGRFSISQSTVTGFAIPHSRLESSGKPDDTILPELLAYDYPLQENEFLTNPEDGKQPEILYESQTAGNSGFEYYKRSNAYAVLEEKTGVPENLKKLIVDSVEKEGKISVSASAMGKYFPCPRRWLFSDVLKLEEDSLNTELFNVFDVGNMYHRVLEKFFGWYCENKKPIPLVNEYGELPDENEIREKISGCLREVIFETEPRKALSFQQRDTKSILLKESLVSQIEKISEFYIPVLRSLCTPYDERHTKDSGFGNSYILATEGKVSDDENTDYRLYGEIDGVFCDDDKISIIDYKTNYTKSPAECTVNPEDYDRASDILPELKDFQIPMYVHLLRKSRLIKAGDLEQVLFFSLKKSEKRYIIKQPQLNKDNKTKYYYDHTVTLEEFETTLEVFKRYAETFASEIKACKSFEPDFKKVKDYEHCESCPYKTVCRTTYIKR